MARSKKDHTKGVSLAKGPASIVGIVLLAAGILGFIFGDRSFTSNPVDGTVNGDTLLGIETNGWMSLLVLAAGALLLLAAPLHWAAKSIAIVVGLVLGAASIILLVDGDDVFGIAAGNGKTALALGIASIVLLVIGLLPRVGKKQHHDHDHRADHDAGRVHRAPAPAPVRHEHGEPVGTDRVDHGHAHDHGHTVPADTATGERAREGAVSPGPGRRRR